MHFVRGSSQTLSAMKKIIAAFVMLLAWAQGWACSCAGIASIDEAVADHPFLVEAQVVSLEEANSPEFGRQVYSVKLRVKANLKGAAASETIVVEHLECYASLYPALMQLGHTYVLPLNKMESGRYSMAECAHSGMELVGDRLYTFEQTTGLERKRVLFKQYSAFRQGLLLRAQDGR
jgi:hypothetical protein